MGFFLFLYSRTEVSVLRVCHMPASQLAWGWVLSALATSSASPLPFALAGLAFQRVLWLWSHWDVSRVSDPARLLWTVSGPRRSRTSLLSLRLAVCLHGKVVTASPVRPTGGQAEGRPPSLLSHAAPGTRKASQGEGGAGLRRARVVD